MLKWKEQIKILREHDILVRECRMYSEFLPTIRRFAAGDMKALFLIGSRGCGKSWLVKRMKGICYTNTSTSPVGIYREAYRYKDKLLALDDLDALFKNPDAVPLFKALLDIDKPAWLSWKKQNAWLASEGIPLSFKTLSNSIIIANKCPRLDDNMLAMLDRAEVCYFFSTPAEVHQYVGTFWNMSMHKDVYDFVGENIKSATSLSIRWYELIRDEKPHNSKWREEFLKRLHGEDEMMALMAFLENSPMKKGERCMMFMDQFKTCRATYFNYLKDYNDAQGTACSAESFRLLDLGAND